MDDVLTFWFGEDRADPWGVTPALQQRWFTRDAAFDATITERFGARILATITAPLPTPATPAALLATIVLLDQFPRNAFRGTAGAFAGDPYALALARHAVATGADRALRPIERIFAYLPFEHAEDRALQAESVRLFDALRAEHPDAGFAAATLDYARRHQDVVERFGRFPHRNAWLGRPSTDAEIAFLATPGSSF